MRRLVGLGLSVFALALAPAMAAGATPALPEGLWLNPHDSVVVKTGPCNGKSCGWVVWANREAMADARDGGVARLVGTELLEDYVPAGRGKWAGTVYVPDMGRRFDSRIERTASGALEVKGCILGGIFCKTQVWRRIDRLPENGEARP